MRLARWFLCFPVAAAVGCSAFLLIGKFGVAVVYSPQHIARSIAQGMPYFLLSLLPNALFVASATMVAPGRKKTVALVAALLAGMWSLIAAQIFQTGAPWFDILNFVGSLSGVVVGAIFALLFPDMKPTANQSLR